MRSVLCVATAALLATIACNPAIAKPPQHEPPEQAPNRAPEPPAERANHLREPAAPDFPGARVRLPLDPAVSISELRCGLTVVVRELPADHPAAGTIGVALHLPAGVLDDRVADGAAAKLAAKLATAGTRSVPPAEFAARLARHDLSPRDVLEHDVHFTTTVIAAEFPTASAGALPVVLDHMARLVSPGDGPFVDEASVDRAGRLLLASLRDAENASTRITRSLAPRLFADSSFAGDHLDVEAALRAAPSVDAVRTYIDASYVPARGVLAIVGSLDARGALAAAESSFALVPGRPGAPRRDLAYPVHEPTPAMVAQDPTLVADIAQLINVAAPPPARDQRGDLAQHIAVRLATDLLRERLVLHEDGPALLGIQALTVRPDTSYELRTTIANAGPGRWRDAVSGLIERVRASLALPPDEQTLAARCGTLVDELEREAERAARAPSGEQAIELAAQVRRGDVPMDPKTLARLSRAVCSTLTPDLVHEHMRAFTPSISGLVVVTGPTDDPPTADRVNALAEAELARSFSLPEAMSRREQTEAGAHAGLLGDAPDPVPPLRIEPKQFGPGLAGQRLSFANGLSVDLIPMGEGAGRLAVAAVVPVAIGADDSLAPVEALIAFAQHPEATGAPHAVLRRFTSERDVSLRVSLDADVLTVRAEAPSSEADAAVRVVAALCGGASVNKAKVDGLLEALQGRYTALSRMPAYAGQLAVFQGLATPNDERTRLPTPAEYALVTHADAQALLSETFAGPISIAIAGPFDIGSARTAAARHIGALADRSVSVVNERVPSLKGERPRSVRVERAQPMVGERAVALAGVVIPAETVRNAEARAAIDVAARVLERTVAAELNDSDPVDAVLDVSLELHPSHIRPSTLLVKGTASPADAGAVVRLIEAGLQSAASGEIDRHAFERARNEAVQRVRGALADPSAVAERAAASAFFEHAGPSALAERLAALEALTPDAVAVVLAELLSEGRAVSVVLLPEPIGDAGE